MSNITLKNISKTYPGGEQALKGFTLNIEAGQIVTLLGSSGSGKSTLLRIISGFEVPDTGVIKLGNKVIVDHKTFIKPQLRNVGMVFQDYALFPHLTVEENIKFNLKAEYLGDLTSILEITGLTPYKRKYPQELSGGQQQRVALARSIIRKPEILLLDEPFSGLDYNLRDRLREEVVHIIKKFGITAIFVSHDQVEALSISDKIALINQGELEQYDTPENIIMNPSTLYAATFFGKTNIFKGRVKDNKLDIGIGKIRLQGHYEAGDYTVSIRPEFLSLSANKINDSSISCKVNKIKYELNRAFVQVEVQQQDLFVYTSFVGDLGSEMYINVDKMPIILK